MYLYFSRGDELSLLPPTHTTGLRREQQNWDTAYFGVVSASGRSMKGRYLEFSEVPTDIVFQALLCRLR